MPILERRHRLLILVVIVVTLAFLFVLWVRVFPDDGKSLALVMERLTNFG